jgi:excisionase family DNA binding protein
MSDRDIDLSTWLSKPEAAARLGISERTLERMIDADKGPECRIRPRTGKRPEPVYNPQDVDALAAAAAPKPAVNPPAGPANSRQLVPTGEDSMPSSLALGIELIEQLARIANRARPEPAPTPPALWLTIPEAAVYTGLSQAFLRRLARSGELPSVRDRKTKVRRADLDSLDIVDIVSSLARLGREA